ncbi:thioesterase II family protein [Myxacorys almedinensis]|uniref:Alpha/beta fold hydrolase n=1 Tax=Myxacorys almedinensis A TaxID=2690445 RepID=A0A8J7Z7H4_9CYAN|nr:alpha/beta fold hydrolase [Myxacorys almedinensis]NDJ19433.1 alpha/beta fold hydrolase [Myxacorys almedinensis A]
MVISASNPWIKVFNPHPNPSFRLFCFPYAGGSAAVFRQWADSLLPSIEVCAIQFPGRSDRLNEPPFTDIAPLVQTLSQVLDPYLNIPFAFFGHSLGALISFELARYLRAQSAHSPVHLFVSSRRAPQIPDRNPGLYALPEHNFLAELRNLNGTPKPVLENAELMRLLSPTIRADFQLCGTYSYVNQPPLSCPISVFGGTEDTEEPPDLLDRWRLHTSSSFSIWMLPGDHFFLHTQQQPLLEKINNIISATIAAPESELPLLKFDCPRTIVN